MTDADDPSRTFDRARLLRSLGVGAAALGLPAVAGARGRSVGLPRAPSALALRLRQPCDHEPVLRPDPLRHPGRVQALRRHLRVDGLAAQRRRRDGEGDAAGDRRAARDGIAVSVIDRRAFNNPTAEALRRGIPVVSYNADGGRRQPAARLHRPGSLPVGPEVRRSDRRARPGRRRLPLHRHAGAAQHPAAHRRRARRDQGLRQADPRDRRRDGARRGRGASADRGDVRRAQEAARHVRRRRRLDPGRRRRDAEAPPARAAASAQAATTCCRGRCARSPTAISTSRSTSSRTSRASCRSSSSSWSSTAPGSSRRRTRTPGLLFVTRAQRAAVPDDDHAVRRQLRRGRVSGHVTRLTRLRHTGHARIALGP